MEELRNGCKVEKGVWMQDWVQEVDFRARQEVGSAIVRQESRSG